MRVVKPVPVEVADLTATDVPLDEYPVWSAGTYNLGDRVLNGIEAWEVTASSTTEEPTTDSLDWLRLGYANRWRMFRDGKDSTTSQLNAINVTIDYPELITIVSVLGLTGSEVQLTVTDATDGVVYDETAQLIDIGVDDWWGFYFLPYDQTETHVFDGIPPYPGADFDLSIRAADVSSTAAAGRVVAGIDRELGVTNYGTSVGILDYSTKERDGFGNLTLVPRRTVRLTNYDVTVETSRVAFVQSRLSRLAATPALFIGDESQSATIVFGVFRDFTETISTPSVSELTLEVEGF